ncbi:hypothetical protein BLL52_1923 [Rhodoferax antarcticus ANT.BR]|uniref:Uncharacterized protein n=1 Tax=Rhodoferax antarcticus ANT.BR TaxID=1111071 RepID=A0A1Q8YCE8_9BURK|nr:hypothetical protein BLL52_1923 [Rhodoferax antarcticus ANT.BR]
MNDIANHCLRHPELSGKKGLGDPGLTQSIVDLKCFHS